MNKLASASNPWLPISQHRYQLAESPRTAHGQLRWVDINARTLHRISLQQLESCQAVGSDLSACIHSEPAPDQIACIIPTRQPDIWMGFGRQGIWTLRDDGQHDCIIQSPFDTTWQRFNDGCCDEWGRIWVTTLIDDKRAPLAHLYCLQQGKLNPVFGGLTTGNGMAYSTQYRKLFVADTFTKTIRRFDICGDSTTLTSDGWQYTYAASTERPDGACMIDEHHYAVAVIDGFRLDIFNLQHNNPAAPAATISVSLHKPTMPCRLPEPATGLALTSAASSTTQPAWLDGYVCLLPEHALQSQGFSGASQTHLYRL